MTVEEKITNPANQEFNQHSNRGGRIMAGLILIAAGAVLLLKNYGVDFPKWLFTWQMFLIVLGFYIGAKNSFKSRGWWIVSVVGLVFMFLHFFHSITQTDYFWPSIIIGVGLIMIFMPKNNSRSERWKRKCEDKFNKKMNQNINSEDFIDSTSIFGGVKKNVITKNFQGGDIVCFFGGSEINFMQADIKGRVVLEVVQVFGGTKLILPSNWVVITDITAILGGIEDKRPPVSETMLDDTKVLILKGTSIFGGIDIRSYS